MSGRQDYHIHSYYSDGKLSPEEIVDRWEAEGYSAIAVTDHDEYEGSKQAVQYAKGRSMRVIPGIECSTKHTTGDEIHILGYGIRFGEPSMDEALNRMHRLRAARNDRLQRALASMGYEISTDELFAVNDGRYIGKPTFAEVMVQKGWAKDVNEVFHDIYTKPEIAAVQKEFLPTEEVIRFIHAAGGLAVMAHPMEIRRHGEGEAFFTRLETLLGEMRSLGIDGIECMHPSATEEEQDRLRQYARDAHLIVTQGSDFHSDRKERSYEN